MNIRKLLLSAAVVVSLTACDKNSDGDAGTNPVNKGNFILTVTPTAATDVADYLLTTGSLEEGSITTQGNGVEQDGTYRYYVTHNNKFFSMLYGQGNPGAVTVYDIQDGSLNKLANTVTETVQAFAPVNDDILMMKISRNITDPTSTWYRFNTNSLTIAGQGNVNTAELADNGELAFYSWLTQVGNKVYAPFFSIKACCEAGFGTDYPDQAWVAVYNYPDMTLEKVIHDDRTSFIGRYFTDGLSVTENGDVYAYSSAIATSDGAQDFNTTKPSSVTRINAGTTEFDQSFLINFEELSGGLNITDWLYLGNNKFVVFSNTEAEKNLFSTGNIVGILDVTTQSYTKVSGMPELKDIKAITQNNYTPADGNTGYIGVNLTTGVNYVYKIDANAATATRGLKIEGGTLTAIEHLD
ncbi:DUF4374 domain-containing protein [Sphingobacterium sp. JB170]|uniref:DUF4374 domain-containing protein n=1 Tax=Sphingobacterium sp. JB170 TaxID=1434842 RepID=UPI00097F3F6C|nr:DUF4374 domain-containing protein [Sphingobacterium sp. JB170]SJN19889.1 hypothetical protein FM107_02045 [Sphingobacterium sp. JB170]